MKLKAYISQNSEVIYTLLLAVIILSLPYSHFISSLGAILLGAFWLFSGDWNNKFMLLRKNVLALTLLVLFVVMLFSLLYTDHFFLGWHEVEKKLALLVFPVVLGSVVLGEKKQRLLLIIYVISAVASAFYGLTGLYSFYLSDVAQGKDMDLAYYQWSLPFVADFLAPRWGMFVGGAAIVSFCLFMNTRKWLYLLMFLLLTSFIVFLASRMALAALLLMVFLYCMILAIQKNKVYLMLMPLAFLFLAGGVVWVSSPYLQGKLVESSGTSERSYRWSAGVEAWLNNPMIGYGAGSGTAEVERMFLAKNHPVTIKGLEVHNQYLSFLVHFGLLGFTCLFAGFILVLYHGWKTRNILSVLLITFFYCTFFTESVLENQQGVFTFALFYSLTACTPLNNAIRL